MNVENLIERGKEIWETFWEEMKHGKSNEQIRYSMLKPPYPEWWCSREQWIENAWDYLLKRGQKATNYDLCWIIKNVTQLKEKATAELMKREYDRHCFSTVSEYVSYEKARAWAEQYEFLKRVA